MGGAGAPDSTRSVGWVARSFGSLTTQRGVRGGPVPTKTSHAYFPPTFETHTERGRCSGISLEPRRRLRYNSPSIDPPAL